jgi:hypothetical protein
MVNTIMLNSIGNYNIKKVSMKAIINFKQE